LKEDDIGVGLGDEIGVGLCSAVMAGKDLVDFVRDLSVLLFLYPPEFIALATFSGFLSFGGEGKVSRASSSSGKSPALMCQLYSYIVFNNGFSLLAFAFNSPRMSLGGHGSGQFGIIPPIVLK